MVYKLTKVYTNDTLAIGLLKNIFSLYTKTQDYHLKYPNALFQML